MFMILHPNSTVSDNKIASLLTRISATICLPLVFGIYMVGAEFTFDVYRVIDGKKKPLSFDPINFRTYSRRVLRAIIAIKVPQLLFIQELISL